MFAQRLFNNQEPRLQGGQTLVEDGAFGPRTQAAIRTFQTLATPALGRGGEIQSNILRRDGSIDDATWRALGAGQSREHNVTLIAQYNNNTCWHACMDMLLGGGRCRDMPAGVLITNRTAQHGQLANTTAARGLYALALGGRIVPAPQTARELCGLIDNRPGVLLGRSVRFQNGHAVVLSGYYKDAASDDLSTVLRIHNPDPPGRGTIEGSLYPFMSVSGGSFTPEWVIVR